MSACTPACGFCGRCTAEWDDEARDPEYPDHVAVASRVMQFLAGPNEYRFYACVDCLPALARGDFNDLFFATANEPVREESPDETVTCDLCREG